MFDLTRDVRHAARRLARTPMFTVATLLTLALGIGANTAIFSIVNSALLKPLPFPEPDRLVGLWQTAPGVNITDLNASIADYITYREESRTLADVAIWNGNAFTVTGLAEPERVDGISATFRLLPMLGVQPILGRAFAERDDEVGSPEVVMLSHGYWQRRFGGDPGVVGRRIMVDGTAREIIGVLPKGFWFMDVPHDLVLPLRFERAKVRLAGYNFQAIGRLRPGVSIAGGRRGRRPHDRHRARQVPAARGHEREDDGGRAAGPNLRPLIDDLVGDVGQEPVGGHGDDRDRAAHRLRQRRQSPARPGRGARPGARRPRRPRRGTRPPGKRDARGKPAAGPDRRSRRPSVWPLAALKLVLSTTPARLPRLELIAVDATSMAFTLVLSVAAGLAFGAIPVLKRSRVRLAEALRAGGRNASAGRDRNVTRNTLTIVQVALAVVLLIGSGLMIRTFQSMRRVQPVSANPATLQTLRIAIPRDIAADDARLLVLQQSLVDSLASLPGVSSVSLMNGLPMTGFSSQDPIFASDHSYAADTIPPLRRFIRVAPARSGVLGTPLAAGREYDWTDIHQKRAGRADQRELRPRILGLGGAAIGKRIRSNPNDPWSEVIGVVGDVRHDGADRPSPSTVYWPMRSSRSATFMIRGPRAGTDGYAADIRRAVAAVSGGLPVTQMQTMQQVYDKSMSRTAFTLTLLGISGGMALLLAAIGIYAVIAYTVAQRTREIGIRLALGARQERLQLMFVRSGMLWGGIGAAAGLVAAAPLSQLMSALLFEVAPIDPPTYAVVLVGSLAAAAVASYLPARRVTRIHPVEALRAE